MPESAQEAPVSLPVSLLTQTMGELKDPEPALIALCEELEAQGETRIVEFLDEAINAMARARGALGRARGRLKAKGS